MKTVSKSLLLPVLFCAFALNSSGGARGGIPVAAEPAQSSPQIVPNPGASKGKALSPVERSLVGYIDEHQSGDLALLERLVNVNSGTQNLAGVHRTGRMLQQEFESLGFETRWVDGRAFGRAGHLIAERPGNDAAVRVLLIGHLDTVFSQDSPFQRFERLPGNHARGPGVIDMKGGDVVMLAALRALKAVGELDRLHVTVVFSGDEEDPGTPLASARRDLITAGRGAAVALGFEDGDGNPHTAVIARRGSVDWHLEVTGTPAHSSQIFQPEVGAGAIFEAARILDGFYRRLSTVADLTLSPGLVLAGTDVSFDSETSRGTAFGKSNVVAGRAVAAGDLRTLSPAQLTDAQTTMKALVANGLPGTTARLTFGEGYPPMAPTVGNRRLLELLDRTSRDLDLGAVSAVDPRNAGAADVSFVAAEVPMVLDGLGLMGSGGHTVEETADLSTFPTQTAKAALLLYRIAQGAVSSEGP